MSSFPYPAVIFAALRRSVSIAALPGAVMLAGPLAPAVAQSEAPLATRPAPAARHQETVEQRIARLHAELKITPAEESDWQAVAQTMRDNVAAMQKLMAEKSAKKTMTAVEALQTYAQFAQAHVDGLKSLVASFQTLYNSMPQQQQKLADQVFQRFKS